MHKLLCIVCLFVLSSSLTFANINFYEMDIEQAVALAKKQNKHVFIDTYAVWCLPCKKMDKIFAQPEVASYFNEHFISVKVNMDQEQGKQVSQAYDVVWLPTLIMLDGSGEVQSKIDKLVSAAELLDIAKTTVRSTNTYQATTLNQTPFGLSSSSSAEKKQEKIVTEDDAPIVYVYDAKASSGRPHIMYHEAYLHLQLMDGKHQRVVQKYLSTQPRSEWSTDKNVKFIFDFLDRTDSKEFDFFTQNRSLFDRVVGKENAQRSLEILIYQKLNAGIPRPDLTDAIQLYTLINPQTAEEKAYNYYLKRIASENKLGELKKLSASYLKDINPYDHQIMYAVASADLKQNRGNADITKCLSLMNEALLYEDQSPQYYLLTANLYFLKGDKNKANQHCQSALALAKQKGIDPQEIIKLQQNIASL